METTKRHAALALLKSVCKDASTLSGSSTFVSSSDVDIWDFYDYVAKVTLSRGLEILLVDLPKVGKIYDSGLSSGIIHLKGLPFGQKTSSILFRGLLSKTFDERGCLKTDCSDVVFMTRSILYLFKKVQIDCPTQKVKDSVDEYVSIEKSLKCPSGTWDSDTWLPQRFSFRNEQCLRNVHPRAEKLWKTVDDVFASIVPMSEVNGLNILGRHGPGAVADLKSGEDKFTFPHWPTKLDNFFPWCAHAQHREDLHISEETTSILSPCEPPARLIAVPKTYSGPRLIASEPTAHQFIQQGLMTWLRKSLTRSIRTSYAPFSQIPSREAAKLASKRGDMATVDLSSASDRLSCWVVERALGANQSLLMALHACRTRTLVDATGSDPDLSLKLKKFAAQGSAVTFPIQSIVYIGLCISALHFIHNKKVTKRSCERFAREVRVYGDDIIIHRNAVVILETMLNAVQLKVNVSKTHTSGAFRESCGMDAFRGNDVTPCYISSWSPGSSPAEVSSWVDVSNNAHRKGLWHLSSYMESKIRSKMRKLMITTNTEGDGFRLYSFCNGFVTDGRVRFSDKLHRDEALVLVSRSLPKKRKRGSWNDLYEYFIEAPSPEVKWTAGIITKNSHLFRREWVPIN